MPIITLNTNGTGNISLANRSNSGGINMSAPPPLTPLPTPTPTPTPSIVTSGLILNLDATNASSYPGTGTTWTDLSVQNNTGTLVGSPTYTSNPGYFTFSANRNVSTALSNISLSAATFIAWVYPTQTQAQYTGILFNRTGFGGSTALATGMNLFTNNSIGYHWVDTNFSWNSGLSTPNNQWSMIVMSINSTAATAYLCQSSGITSATNTTSHSSVSGLNFFIACDPGFTADRAFIGRIAISMIYNTALSLTDITTNFNVTKTKFGL